MQYNNIEIRVREERGQRIVEIDGYHHVHPESKPSEYRRVAIVDLSEGQARELYDRLGEIVDDWDAD